MKIQLSEHFTYKKLLRFVLPSIVMMIFTSIYGVVDGLFVSNYVGKTAFAAVNLIMPFLMAISALGFMIGTGGSAIVAKTLGEGKKEQANEYFSMLVYLTLIGGIVLSALGILFSPLIARGLGADGALLTNCVLYARITLLSMPAFMLQNVFQSFFVTAEKPKLGLGVIVIAGVTNMVLDFLLVGVFQIGLAGAAFATVTSECIGGLFPILYFARKNSSLLKLGRTHFNGKIFLCPCGNGSSELMTNLSSSIVNSLYNIQLMNLAGENGVAAFGTIMYVNFIFIAIFLLSYPVQADNLSYSFSFSSTPLKSSKQLVSLYGTKTDNNMVLWITDFVSPILSNTDDGITENKNIQMTYIIIKSTRNPATAPPTLFTNPITGIWSISLNIFISLLKKYLTTKNISINITV